MKKAATSPQRFCAKAIFEYLSISSNAIPCADVVIGFGHFDLNIPRQCGELYKNGFARKIIFTGGIGSGTADLGKPEAIAFAEELKRLDPTIPDSAIIVEAQSTNTSENIQFTAQKLATLSSDFIFGNQINTAIIVANAYRQRRVWLTCRKHLPQVAFYNAPPQTTFEDELDLFASKGLDLVELLLGEIDRIIRYGEQGYLIREKIPQEIYENYRLLKDTLPNQPTPMETMTLYRPTGPKEMELLKQGGFKRWPPRLPEQPIFYPVTNEEYAREIAVKWNVPESGVGYVTKFKVQKGFMERYEIHQVGASHHTEWWIPAEDLEELNDHIVGEIEVIGEYGKNDNFHKFP